MWCLNENPCSRKNPIVLLSELPLPEEAALFGLVPAVGHYRINFVGGGFIHFESTTGLQVIEGDLALNSLPFHAVHASLR